MASYIDSISDEEVVDFINETITDGNHDEVTLSAARISEFREFYNFNGLDSHDIDAVLEYVEEFLELE